MMSSLHSSSAISAQHLQLTPSCACTVSNGSGSGTAKRTELGDQHWVVTQTGLKKDGCWWNSIRIAVSFRGLYIVGWN